MEQRGGAYVSNPPTEPKRNPQTALEAIRQRLQGITQEYSSGKLNAVQFNAIYRHYMEKRMIIEKLIERNPESDAWRAAASSGHTTDLKDRYESRPLYYVIFRKGEKRPLLFDGKLPKKAAEQLHKLLEVFWKMQVWRQGLARKSVGDGMWLMLMVGENAMTIAIYFLQPSTLQVNKLKDLHADFERANTKALERGFSADRMVFPQRALTDSRQ
jgi:hypothetical protein